VERVALDIHAEIMLIRARLDAKVRPKPAVVQVGLVPTQVFAKGREVLVKLARLQGARGMRPVEPPEIPLKDVRPPDVYALLQDVLHELRRTKTHLGITQRIVPARRRGRRTPSHVYEALGRASYALDAVAGAIDPTEVYRQTARVRDDLAALLRHLGRPVPKRAPPASAGRTPTHVYLEATRALLTVARAERRLGLRPVRVPDVPGGALTTSDVANILNMLSAELVRLKVHSGLAGHPPAPADSGSVPDDVWPQMRLVTGLATALAEEG